MEDNWSACLQTLEGHSDAVRSVIFSHDSKLLASGSDDGTVRVWDASNGHCLQTLEGHRGDVNSVIFSYDSKLLASGSDDGTVRVWDASNGQCLQTLEGHSGAVRSVIFSHDSKLLASASDDCTVRVWDASNGQCLQTLNVEKVASEISFDIANSYLEIDNRTIHLCLDSDTRPTKTDPGVLRFQGYGVSSDLTWITWNLENLLWLPPEYRPSISSISAVATSTISIGCASGRVLIFNFDSQRLLRFLVGN